MPQSLAKVLIHLIFSTKDRLLLIPSDFEPDLHAYMAGILKQLKCQAGVINGYEEHIHVLCCLSRSISIASLVNQLKSRSSLWMRSKNPGYSKFQWQVGYSVFSVSQSKEAIVKKYIEQQREHHKHISFQDEYRKFLQEYKVPFDERYVWD